MWAVLRAPVGVGFHPYFIGTESVDKAEAKIPATGYLEFNEQLAPTGKVLSARERSGIIASFVPSANVDSTIVIWNSSANASGMATASLRHRESGRTIGCGDGSCVLDGRYTGDAIADVPRRALAIEPMTCATDAFNHPDWGLKRLLPGETFGGSSRSSAHVGLDPSQPVMPAPSSRVCHGSLLRGPRRFDDAEAHLIHLGIGRGFFPRKQPPVKAGQPYEDRRTAERIAGTGRLRGHDEAVLRDRCLRPGQLGSLFKQRAGQRHLRPYEAVTRLDDRYPAGCGEADSGSKGIKSCAPVGESSRITFLAGMTKRNQAKSASRPTREAAASSVFCGFKASTAFAASSASDEMAGAAGLAEAALAAASASTC